MNKKNGIETVNARELHEFLESKQEFSSNEEYLKLANELALKIIPKWDKDSLPVSTMSEKAHYIRDLILLRFVYDIS